LYENECPDIIHNAEFIQHICHRRTGIGADAVLILSDVEGYDFKIDYYNSDGTWETFCANGSRCAALSIYTNKLCCKKMIFLAGDGQHEVEIISEDYVKLKMTAPKYETELLTINGFKGRHVNSGAKHFTSPSENISPEFMEEFAPPIRYSKEFMPNGINVNFFNVIDSHSMHVVTYEKGIEKVMLSCGSGSVASVYHSAQINHLESPVNVTVPGGELIVHFDNNWQNVWLEGPAVLLFSSEIEYNIH